MQLGRAVDQAHHQLCRDRGIERPQRSIDETVDQHRRHALDALLQRPVKLRAVGRLGQRAGRREAQQRALGRELEAHQHARRQARALPAAAARLLGEVEGAADDLEGALEAGRDQVQLVVVVVIERALGDIEPRRDLVDRGAAVALLVEQRGGRAQEGIHRGVVGGRVQRGILGQRRRFPSRRRRAEPVEHDVGDARDHARVLRLLVAAEPGRQPVHQRQQQMGTRIAHLARPMRRGLVLEQPAHAAEHAGVGGVHGLELRARQRAHVAEGHHRRMLAERHRRQQRGMARQEGAHPRRHRGLARRGLGDAVEQHDGAQEAGGGQVFLLAVVVGDAVGHQTHAGRDARQGRALDALCVELRRGRVEDGIALFLETRGLRLAGGDGGHGGKLLRRREGRWAAMIPSRNRRTSIRAFIGISHTSHLCSTILE